MMRVLVVIRQRQADEEERDLDWKDQKLRVRRDVVNMVFRKPFS
jgi:hypothetical protein